MGRKKLDEDKRKNIRLLVHIDHIVEMQLEYAMRTSGLSKGEIVRRAIGDFANKEFMRTGEL